MTSDSTKTTADSTGQPKRVPVHLAQSWAVPPSASAWVPLPRLILHRDPQVSVRLLAHELQHVLQAERYSWRWPFVYVIQWARNRFDYFSMPFEVEARLAEGDLEMRAWAEEIMRSRGLL